MFAQIGKWRALARVIESRDFELFYSQADEAMKSRLTALVAAADKDTILKILKADNEKTVKQLRAMCRNRNIKNYHLMCKAELLSMLESVRDV